MPIVHFYQPSPESRAVIDPRRPETPQSIMAKLLEHKYTPQVMERGTLQDITPFATTEVRYILEVTDNQEEGVLHLVRKSEIDSVEATIRSRSGRLITHTALKSVQIKPGSEMVPILRRYENSEQAVIGACVLHLGEAATKALLTPNEPQP